MRDITPYNWESFKEVFEKKKLWLQYSDMGTFYDIFVVDTSLFYTYKLVKTDPRSDEQVDFEDNYKTDANRPLNLSGSSSTSYFGSKQIVIEGNEASGYCEWSFPDMVYFGKMMPLITAAEWGDYAQVTVHLPDGTPIREYSDKLHCYGNQPQGWIEGHGAGQLPAGLLLRVTYTKAPGSQSARKIIIWAEFLV